MKINEIRKGEEIGKPSSCLSCNYIWAACARCAEERWTRYDKARAKPIAAICSHCAQIERGQNQREANNSHWMGGRRPDGKGYIVVVIQPDNPYFPMTNSRGEVLEHRLIMAKHLGRCLEAHEIIHHINSNREDNRIENLELIVGRHNHIPYNVLQMKIKELQRENRRLEQRLLTV